MSKQPSWLTVNEPRKANQTMSGAHTYIDPYMHIFPNYLQDRQMLNYGELYVTNLVEWNEKEMNEINSMDWYGKEIER